MNTDHIIIRSDIERKNDFYWDTDENKNKSEFKIKVTSEYFKQLKANMLEKKFLNITFKPTMNIKDGKIHYTNKLEALDGVKIIDDDELPELQEEDNDLTKYKEENQTYGEELPQLEEEDLDVYINTITIPTNNLKSDFFDELEKKLKNAITTSSIYGNNSNYNKFTYHPIYKKSNDEESITNDAIEYENTINYKNVISTDLD